MTSNNRINVEDVPESQDTLFMRGFDGNLELDLIREFFTREGGKCKFDFFKQSADKRQLFVALRFESRKSAREIKERYDGREVLGSRVEISFFKDIRKYAALAKMGGGSYSGRERSLSGSGGSGRSRPQQKTAHIPITNANYPGGGRSGGKNRSHSSRQQRRASPSTFSRSRSRSTSGSLTQFGSRSRSRLSSVSVIESPREKGHMSGGGSSSSKCDFGPDDVDHYCASLAARMKKLNDVQRARIRIKIEQLMFETAYPQH